MVDEIKGGFRPSSIDYFPIIGQVLDIKKNIKRYPSIKNGTKIPKDKLFYMDNIYIHTAHGGRGFVTAPYSAKILTEHIFCKKDIDNKLDSSRFFYKAFRKNLINTTKGTTK